MRQTQLKLTNVIAKDTSRILKSGFSLKPTGYALERPTIRKMDMNLISLLIQAIKTVERLDMTPTWVFQLLCHCFLRNPEMILDPLPPTDQRHMDFDRSVVMLLVALNHEGYQNWKRSTEKDVDFSPKGCFDPALIARPAEYKPSLKL